MELRGIDVNVLYHHGLNMLRGRGVHEDSRNGPVLVMPEPVMSIYQKPMQRVLHDMRRAANPYFHLYESLWMLAGRDDVAALNTYITDFGTRFAEPDGRVHGAYGHRWRKALGFDQLDAIVARLRAKPDDRQCVLQMWDATTAVPASDDPFCMYEGSNDLFGEWKDRPCNTQVYFRVRTVDRSPTRNFGELIKPEKMLDMTITCRSNDIVYGAYGANAVHFSILMEYMAGRIGVKVGTMYQLSNNYHAYLDVLERVGEPSLVTYASLAMEPTPMGGMWDLWDSDLATFMLWHARMRNGEEDMGAYHNGWFTTTAEPMFRSHWLFKQAMRNEARNVAETIGAEDWRFACLQWLDKRTDARKR